MEELAENLGKGNELPGYHIHQQFFVNRYHIQDVYMRYGMKGDVDGDDVLFFISFCSVVVMLPDGGREYKANVRYNESGDLNLGDQLVVVCDVSSTSGKIYFDIDEVVVPIADAENFSITLEKKLDEIFAIMLSNRELFIARIKEYQEKYS